MATNKNAVIRYQALDRCFSNFYKRFYFDDLIKACNDAIYEYSGIVDGVKKRQLFNDIRFMESKEGYSIPLMRIKDGKSIYYRYADRDFSINKQPLSLSEANHIYETLLILSRFEGIPDSDWIQDILTKLEVAYHLSGSDESVVYFDHNPYLEGLHFFSTIFEAILNHQVISVWYRAAFGPAEQFEISPCILKQYNARWFLWGITKMDGSSRIMNMALDRIDSITHLGKIVEESLHIDFDSYFDDVYGVTVPYGVEPVDIILKIDKDRYNYIASKPIHHSQTVINKSESSVSIRLHLIPNYEFETLILGFADSVEIVEPYSLREKLLARAKDIIEKNNH